METINVGGRLHSIATGNIISGADEILDDELEKKQSVINQEVNTALSNRYTKSETDNAVEVGVTAEQSRAEEAEANLQTDINNRYTKEETYSKEELNSLITSPDVNHVVVASYLDLPDIGSADTIYKVANYDGVQVDTTRYAEYAWNGTQYVLLCVRSQAIEPLVGYYECDTAANSANKEITAANYILTIGGSIKIKMQNVNTAASGVTLNINSTGAKILYYDKEAVSDINTWEAGETVEVYYDGIAYYANNVAGGGKFLTGEKVKDVGIDSELTPGSENLVKSGVVHYELYGDVVTTETISVGIVSGTKVDSTNNVHLLSGKVYRLDISNNRTGGTKLYIYFKNANNDNISVKCSDTKDGVDTASAVTNYQISSTRVILYLKPTADCTVVRIYSAASNISDTANVSFTFTLEPDNTGIDGRIGELENKVDVLEIIDNVPTDGSEHTVKSGGVKADIDDMAAVASIDVSDFEKIAYALLVGDDQYPNGKFGTTGTYYHAAIPVNAGEVYFVYSSNNTYTRYALATTNDAESGVGVPVVNGESVVELAANTRKRVVIKDTCNYLLVNIGDSYPLNVKKYFGTDSVPTKDSQNPIDSNAVFEVDEFAKSVKADAFGNKDIYEKIAIVATAGSTLNKTLSFNIPIVKDCIYIVCFELNSAVSQATFQGLKDKDGNIVSSYFNGSSTASNTKNMNDSDRYFFTMQPTDDAVAFNIYTSSANVTGGTCYMHFWKVSNIKGLSEKADLENKDFACAHLSRKAIITDRPYYFNDSYADVESYEEVSYLEKKIMSVPEGKHFIFNTDSHVDYGRVAGGSLGSGWEQKETVIMKYVKDRLGIKNVVFGGDCVGGILPNYKAAKILQWYCNDKFEAFGSDFLFCMGNHDVNYPMYGNQSEGDNITRAEAVISDSEAYKRTTYNMLQYGVVKFNTRLLNAIDQLTDITDEGKAELKAWAMLHYYCDDDKQKIRYIVLETHDFGNAVTTYIGRGYHVSGFVYSDFLVESLLSVPEDYDVVVVGHQFSQIDSNTDLNGNSVNWNITFYNILSAYKQKKYIAYKCRAINAENTAVQLYNILGYGTGTYRKYSFKDVVGSGRIFTIGGHYHADDAWLTSVEQDVVCEDYSGENTVYNDSVLSIICDRCCLVGKSSSWINYHQYSSSYPNNGTGAGEEERLGTVNEVLFDVVTITPDNKIVCTRFGAGNDRTYDLPVISES